MTEEFLHHIWKFRLFNQQHLLTQQQQTIIIKNVGEQNTDAGPDFFNARIAIGDTLWAGNVEIHINASDWNKHDHPNNKAYDNIILHVVYNNDTIIHRNNGEPFPTLELKLLIHEQVYERYLHIKSNTFGIPCEKLIHTVNNFTITTWLNRLMVERLEGKALFILNKLELNKNNWEETFYQLIGRTFGQKVNAIPFELLTKALPFGYVSKHKDNLLQLEALFYGTAGLLENVINDTYYNRLQLEFKFLKQKFDIKPIDGHLWKFLRLRPANFPTLRIAQFAQLIHKTEHLFSKLIQAETLNELIALFDITTSSYWENHYQFGKVSLTQQKKLGNSAIESLLINTVIPLLFVYGKHRNEEKYSERALLLAEKIKPEKNSTISAWQSLNLCPKTAGQTQALLQLTENYCRPKKCLQCAIGNKIITVTDIPIIINLNQ